MSKLELMRHLYAHNEWANNRLLEVASGLTDDELSAERGASFDSIIASFAHIAAAQVGWAQRWHIGGDGGHIREMQKTRDFTEIRAMFERSHAAMSDFLAAATDEKLESVLHYANSAGQQFQRQYWQILMHVAHHGIYHRGEIALMLSAIGHSPGDLDFIYWEFMTHPDG